MKNKSKSILIVALLLISGILLAVNQLNITTQATASDYNTGIPLSSLNNLATSRGSENVWTGQNCPGTGYPYKELIADTKYVTSFSRTGNTALSERIHIQGNLFENSLVEVNTPQCAYYVIWIKEKDANGNLGNWREVLNANVVDTTVLKITGSVAKFNAGYNGWNWDNDELWFPSIEIQVIGPRVGALKVSLYVEFLGFWGDWGDRWTTCMSTDYCYLISGTGKINIKDYNWYDVPMYQIGETIPIQVSADYSGPTAGETGRWQLWAYPLRGGTGRMLKEWTYDYFRETYNWKLPTDAWVRGETDSKWRIELHNTLFSTDAIMINTIDIKANAPPTPTATYTPVSPNAGDEITLTINGKTNPLTNETITSYWIRGTYAYNNQQFLYKNVPVTGSDPFVVTTTITPPDAGKIILQIWAHDKSGRESAVPFKLEIIVNTETGETPPSELINPPTNAPDYTWILIFIVLIIIIGVVLYILYKRVMLKFRRKGK